MDAGRTDGRADERRGAGGGGGGLGKHRPAIEQKPRGISYFETETSVTRFVLTGPALLRPPLSPSHPFILLSYFLALGPYPISTISSPIPDSHTDIEYKTNERTNEPTYQHPTRRARRTSRRTRTGDEGKRERGGKEGGGRRPIRAGVEGAHTRPVASATATATAAARIAMSQISNYALSRSCQHPRRIPVFNSIPSKPSAPAPLKTPIHT